MTSLNAVLWNDIKIEDMERRDEYAAACIDWCWDCICFSIDLCCVSCL